MELSPLLAIERFYRERVNGADLGHLDSPWNLLSIARDADVQLSQPKGQVVVAVIGDSLCGKSSFLNALAEELVFSQRNKSKGSAIQWAVSDEIQKGEWPGLLQRAVKQFPKWEPKALATARMCEKVMGSRLKGLQLVEIPSPTDLLQEDLEVVQYMLSAVDIVACLLDSQAKHPLSDEMLTVLNRVLDTEEAPPLHFLLAKADLVSRESDRIRLIAKSSRMLQERLGRGRRGFEILPVSTGDVNVLLDILELEADAADGSNGLAQAPKWDAGRMRTWELAQDLKAQRMKEALKALELDVQALQVAVASRRHDPQVASSHFTWFGAALAIVTAMVPYVLDEEDSSMVPIFMTATIALACLCFLLAFFLSRSASKKPAAESDSMDQQERFLSLVEKQCQAWKMGEKFQNGEDEMGGQPESCKKEYRTAKA